MSSVHRRRAGEGRDSAGEQDPPGPAPLRGLPRTGAGVPLWAEGACFALLAVAAVGVLLFVYLQRPHHGLRVFTPEELRPYDGSRDPRIHLAIMGRVYDVTSGRRHYGKGGGYSFFAGRDASRAYVTGQFQADLNDDTSGFSAEQFAELVRWREFFDNHKTYRQVGVAVGAFYDADGHPTPLVGRAEALAEEEREAREAERRQRKRAQQAQQQGEEGAGELAGGTPCNVRWTKAEGGSVWCPSGQFPRQVAGPTRDGQLSTRCACFASDVVDASRRLYAGCAQRAEACATSPPQQ